MTAVQTLTEERVAAAITRLEPRYRALLQTLVRIPSVIGEESAAQARVEAEMREMGLRVDVFDVDSTALEDLPAFNRSRRGYTNRPCVVGKIPGAGGGRSLLL